MPSKGQDNTRVAALLDDIRLTNPPMYELAQAVRSCVQALNAQVAETVKYGGIMFGAPEPFCGLFVYSEHASLEFGKGCELVDTYNRLEGKGKFRRHIKLRVTTDVNAVSHYLEQAFALANTPL